MASNSNQHDPGQQANVEPAGAATLMSSFFPSPPASFSNYTSANIALAKRLIAHPDYDARLASDTTPTWQEQQRSILGQLNVASEVITSVQDVDLRTLVEPPDVSLIEEQGHWMAFGQVWPVSPSQGMQRLHSTTAHRKLSLPGPRIPTEPSRNVCKAALSRFIIYERSRTESCTPITPSHASLDLSPTPIHPAQRSSFASS